MNGAVSAFNFSYGFSLALLGEWFYPLLAVFVLLVFFILLTAFIKAVRRLRK